MTDIQTNIPGIKGQTRSTWRDTTHLRGMLLKLMTQNRGRHPRRIGSPVSRQGQEDTGTDRRGSASGFRQRSFGDPAPARQAPDPISKEEVAATAERLTNVVLLDLILRTARPCATSTGKECRQAGGWLTKIADRVGDRGVVGATLDEPEIAAIFANSARPGRGAR